MAAIEQVVTVDVPREKVFQALTEAEMLEQWWVTRAETEPETGGRFRLEWEFAERPDGVQEGSYLEVDRPGRVRLPWDAGGDTEVVFELADADGGTEVTVRHSGWTEALEESRQMHEQVWTFYMGNLVSVLGGGQDQRAQALGQAVG